jgi:hypothetical protein
MGIKGFGNSAVGTFTDFLYFLKTFSWLVGRHKVSQVKNTKKAVVFLVKFCSDHQFWDVSNRNKNKSPY